MAKTNSQTVMMLLLCSSMSESNDFVQIPLQRNAMRNFAADNDLTIEGEILVELLSDADLAQIAESVAKKTTAAGERPRILISNISLFNESGLAARLIPLLSESGQEVIAVAG